MKIIALHNGGEARCSDEDFESLSRHRWYFGTGGYAVATINRKRVSMHRFLLGMMHGDGKVVDHINGDGLDNCRTNIRVCQIAENARNRRRATTCKSGFKGVHRTNDGRSKVWLAQITVNRKKINLGRHDTPEAAHQAYVDAARKYFGEFARAA